MYIDFEEIVEHELKNRGRVCIQGVPGSGKTFFCKQYCQSRDYITVYIDCKTDRMVLKQIIELKKQKSFADAFKEYAGLSKFQNERIYVIFDNIDTSKYFSEVYWSFRNADFMLMMTYCVYNTKVRGCVSDCNVVIKRPFGFFEIYDVYNSSLSYDTYNQMLANKEIPRFVHNSLDKYFSEYLIYGGLGYPYSKFKNDDVNEDDLDLYFQYQFNYTLNRIFDYADLAETDIWKCKCILKAIAYQILNDGYYNKLSFTNVAKGMTFNKSKDALEFLINNNILYQIECDDYPGNKLYYFYDCGILYHYTLQLSNELDIDMDESKIEAILYKNFVTTELMLCGIKPHIWKNNNTAVVDFVFDYNDKLFALVVNDNNSSHTTALGMYQRIHENAYVLSLSTENLIANKKIINSPIYSISCIDVLF